MVVLKFSANNSLGLYGLRWLIVASRLDKSVSRVSSKELIILFICLPSKLGSSSSTTYFGTNMYGPIGNNDYVARSKVYSSHATNTNLITSVFDYTYSSATNTTTSRLIKYEN